MQLQKPCDLNVVRWKNHKIYKMTIHLLSENRHWCHSFPQLVNPWENIRGRRNWTICHMSSIFNLWLTFLNQRRPKWLRWCHLVDGSVQNNHNPIGNTIQMQQMKRKHLSCHIKRCFITECEGISKICAKKPVKPKPSLNIDVVLGYSSDGWDLYSQRWCQPIRTIIG